MLQASGTTPWRGSCATASESRFAAEGLVDHSQGEWLDRVRDDLENYRSALNWLVERDRSIEASSIVYRLFFFWVIRGHAVALASASLEPIRELHDKFAYVHTLVPLAAAVALQGEDVWAAQILGTRHAVTEATGATIVDRSVNELRDDTERAVRARLGEDRWARAYAVGRKTTIDSLMKDIDSRRLLVSTRRES